MHQTTCKICHNPIYFVLHLGLWYHEDQIDILTCPAEYVEPAEA